MSNKQTRKNKNKPSNKATKISRQHGIDFFGRNRPVKPNLPGKPGGILLNTRKRRISPYGESEREIKKVLIFFNIKRKQLTNACNKAGKQSKIVPEDYLKNSLELQLANVIFRAKYATSPRSAAQLVSHKKVYVTRKGKEKTLVNCKSFICQIGDIIELKKESFDNKHVQNSISKNVLSTVKCQWLKVEKNKTTIIANPYQSNVHYTIPINYSQIIKNI